MSQKHSLSQINFRKNTNNFGQIVSAILYIYIHENSRAKAVGSHQMPQHDDEKCRTNDEQELFFL